MVTWLVTGGCGFIGSCFIRTAFASDPNLRIVNLDKLTYAGHPENLPGMPEGRYTFVHGAIEDAALVRQVLKQHEPDAVVHFAAESHVDRSIDGPADFVQTNVFGTVTLLEQSLRYWQSKKQPADFRFLNISTDEVYGSLGESGLFTESTAHAPNSPYAASKAAADGFARSFHRTYGLPVIITNNCNPIIVTHMI